MSESPVPGRRARPAAEESPTEAPSALPRSSVPPDLKVPLVGQTFYTSSLAFRTRMRDDPSALLAEGRLHPRPEPPGLNPLRAWSPPSTHQLPLPRVAGSRSPAGSVGPSVAPEAPGVYGRELPTLRPSPTHLPLRPSAASAEPRAREEGATGDAP